MKIYELNFKKNIIESELQYENKYKANEKLSWSKLLLLRPTRPCFNTKSCEKKTRAARVHMAAPEPHWVQYGSSARWICRSRVLDRALKWRTFGRRERAVELRICQDARTGSEQQMHCVLNKSLARYALRTHHIGELAHCWDESSNRPAEPNMKGFNTEEWRSRRFWLKALFNQLAKWLHRMGLTAYSWGKMLQMKNGFL